MHRTPAGAISRSVKLENTSQTEIRSRERLLRSARGVRRDAAYGGARGMIRLLSYFFHDPFHSESWSPGVVARLLPFVRRSRRRFLCHVANATFRIRFQGLELW